VRLLAAGAGSTSLTSLTGLTVSCPWPRQAGSSDSTGQWAAHG